MSNQPPIPDNPWATNQAPASGAKSNTGVVVVITILATVVAVLAAFAAYLLFSRGGTETTVAETSATTAPPAVVETVVETVEETVTAAPATTTASAPSVVSPAPDVAGLTARGWTASPVTRCGAGENLIYAARDGAGSYVTVCSSGDAMTYRSDIFGGTLETPVDAGASVPSQGYFSVPAGRHRIVIDDDRLEVRDGVSVVNSADFAFSYVM